MAVLRKITVIVWLVMGFAAPAQAGVELAEKKIKAGMIYNFLKYAEWPASDNAAPMAVCILGGDPYAGNLSPMEGRSVHQRTITVRAIRIEEVAGCQIVIFNESPSQWPAVHAALTGKPVLTVSEHPDFLQKGGMILFGHEQSRITVRLNMDAAEAAHIDVGQRLLNLVTVVRSGAGEGV